MIRNEKIENSRVNHLERIRELPSEKKVKKTIGEQFVEWVDYMMPNRF